MSENVALAKTPSANGADAQTVQAGLASTSSNPNGHGAPRANRPPNRNVAVQSSTNKYFEGATPKLGAILALCSENIIKKVNYDCFLEKLAIYVVNEFKNGDSIVETTKTKCYDSRRFSEGK